MLCCLAVSPVRSCQGPPAGKGPAMDPEACLRRAVCNLRQSDSLLRSGLEGNEKETDRARARAEEAAGLRAPFIDRLAG